MRFTLRMLPVGLGLILAASCVSKDDKGVPAISPEKEFIDKVSHKTPPSGVQLGKLRTLGEIVNGLPMLSAVLYPVDVRVPEIHKKIVENCPSERSTPPAQGTEKSYTYVVQQTVKPSYSCDLQADNKAQYFIRDTSTSDRVETKFQNFSVSFTGELHVFRNRFKWREIKSSIESKYARHSFGDTLTDSRENTKVEKAVTLDDGKIVKFSGTKLETTQKRDDGYHTIDVYQIKVTLDDTTFDLSIFESDSQLLYFYLGNKSLDVKSDKVLSSNLKIQLDY